MRIAFGGFHIECSTYNPFLSREADFTIHRGDALLGAPSFRFLRDYDAQWLPTIHARAVPGGPIERATYERFKAEFLERLAAFGTSTASTSRSTARPMSRAWKTPRATG